MEIQIYTKPILTRLMLTQNEDTPAAECECPICLETTKDTKTTSCRHTFCVQCLDKWLMTNHTCPLCRTELNEPEAKNNLDSHHIYTIPWDILSVDMRPSGSFNYSRIDRIPQFRVEFRS